MFPVPPLAVGNAPLNVMFGVVPPEEARGAEAVTAVTVPSVPLSAVHKPAADKDVTVLSALNCG